MQPIIIALQMCPIDAMEAVELVRLIAANETTRREDFEFAIVARKDTDPALVAEALSLARRRFTVVHEIWGKRNEVGWPDGCNALWQEGMMRCSILAKERKSKADCVLTMEADCVPLRRDWLNVIKEVWRSRFPGTEFIGHIHQADDDVHRHLNGNALIDISALRKHPELNGAGDGGWDFVHRKLILKTTQDSDFFFQIYKMANPTRKNLEFIRKNGKVPALFHGTKGLAGIEIVNAMLADGSLDRSKRAATLDPKEIVDQFRPSTHTDVSIFIRSYEKDFPWLVYCVRSIRKFVQGYSEIVIAVPRGQLPALMEAMKGAMSSKLIFVEIDPIHENGYIDQQISKLLADKYCSGGFIMHVDSDCCFDSPVDIQGDFIAGAMPTILYTLWTQAGEAICWKEPTREALGFEPSFETMCALPIVHHRGTYFVLREYMQAVHGMPAEDYAATVKKFSEFNTLGNFAVQFLSSYYRVVRADPAIDGIPRLRQHWSWGGLTPERVAELHELTFVEKEVDAIAGLPNNTGNHEQPNPEIPQTTPA